MAIDKMSRYLKRVSSSGKSKSRSAITPVQSVIKPIPNNEESWFDDAHVGAVAKFAAREHAIMEQERQRTKQNNMRRSSSEPVFVTTIVSAMNTQGQGDEAEVVSVDPTQSTARRSRGASVGFGI